MLCTVNISLAIESMVSIILLKHEFQVIVGDKILSGGLISNNGNLGENRHKETSDKVIAILFNTLYCPRQCLPYSRCSIHICCINRYGRHEQNSDLHIHKVCNRT